jgi:endonuclease YncB( thermonuclease family)
MATWPGVMVAAVLSVGVAAWLCPPSNALAQETTARERTVRDVTPPGVVRVYRSESAIPEAVDPLPEGAKRIAGALVRRDGAIIGEGASFRLYGVAALNPDRICQGALGERWACGRRAYIAFYNRVKEQDVACKIMEAPAGAATCWADKVELSAWLLGNGLAELAPGVTEPRLRAAEEAARKAKLGIWSDRPADLRP